MPIRSRTALHPGSTLDPVSLAEAVPGDTGLVFQRFDLSTRQVRRSIVALAAEPVVGPDFESSLRRGFNQDEGSPLLVFAGAEAISASPTSGPGDFPNHAVLRLRRYLDFNHQAGTVALVDEDPSLDAAAVMASPHEREPPPTTAGLPGSLSEWEHDTGFAEYERRLQGIRTAIARGEVEGAVLSLGLKRPTTASPFAIYRRLSSANPSPFGFALRLGRHALVGSSPLAFLQMASRRMHLETDAGTRPVTGDHASDEAAAADLLVNPKDATEHAVVVGAERDAMKPIARHGHVDLAIDRQVRRFSHVMHLYSALEADLAEGLDLADAILALAPAAAVSGRPKRRAAELGVEAERGPRGPYGGVIGLVDPRTGEADLAVVIRSLWISDGVARLRVGGKIVAGSDAQAEYRECLAKARFLVEGVAAAEASASGRHAATLHGALV